MGWIYGILGGFVLFVSELSRITFQVSSIERTAYGGIFIVMALLWGLNLNGIPPDSLTLLVALLQS